MLPEAKVKVAVPTKASMASVQNKQGGIPGSIKSKEKQKGSEGTARKLPLPN